jgi:hypothetical protein
MIYSQEALELFEQYEVARAEEDTAGKALRAILTANGTRDAVLEATSRWEEAHSKAMDIRDHLQAYRLDVQ